MPLRVIFNVILNSISIHLADNIDLDESLMETLKNFYDKAKNITELDGNISETELNHILKQLNNAEMNPELKDGLFEMNKIMPLMSNIMENLLSKDFLYPTLAELNLKVRGKKTMAEICS